MNFAVTGETGKIGVWRYVNINSAQEYRDPSKDQSSANTFQQKRDHWVFQRKRRVCGIQQIFASAGEGNDPNNPKVGMAAPAGNLTFFPGGGMDPLTPPSLLDENGDDVEWVCTADRLIPAPEDANFHWNLNTWEAYSSVGWELVV